MEPTVVLNTSSGRSEVSLRGLNLSGRRIFLTGLIDAGMAERVIMELMWLQEASENPVTIYINSPGGEVNSGLAIYDALQDMKVPVNEVCTGLAASMASLLLAGGQKGRRFILPHSKVMIHEPYLSGGVGGSAGSVQNTAEEMLRTQKTFHEIMARHTGRTPEEIAAASDHDHFMSAEEAIEFGICDRIAENLYGI